MLIFSHDIHNLWYDDFLRYIAMTSPMLKLNQLQPYEFLDSVLNHGDRKIFSWMVRNEDFKSQFILKCQQLCNESWIPSSGLYLSRAIVSCLNPQQRGTLFFQYLKEAQNFIATHEISKFSLDFLPEVKEHFKQLPWFELQRLKTDFSHLDNHVNYIEWLEKYFKPNISDESYLFLFYLAFVSTIQSGIRLNTYQFTNSINISIKKSTYVQHYKPCIELIKKFQKILRFENWSDDMKNELQQDFLSQAHYKRMALASWNSSCENFFNRFSDLKKIMFQYDLGNQLAINVENTTIKKI